MTTLDEDESTGTDEFIVNSKIGTAVSDRYSIRKADGFSALFFQ